MKSINCKECTYFSFRQSAPRNVHPLMKESKPWCPIKSRSCSFNDIKFFKNSISAATVFV